jgi:predicted DCC family thiol-disulfide oxidoreductase YuxK
MAKDRSGEAKVTVYYDGACPLCAREIAFYRSRRGAETIDWVDVVACGPGEIAPGLSAERARARFHVRDAAGALVSGGRAFAEVWAALPGFAPLGRLLRLPVFAPILDGVYDAFLRVRPRLQTWLRRGIG